MKLSIVTNVLRYIAKRLVLCLVGVTCGLVTSILIFAAIMLLKAAVVWVYRNWQVITLNVAGWGLAALLVFVIVKVVKWAYTDD